MKLIILPGLNGTDHLLGDFVDQLPAQYSGDIISYPHDRRLDYDALTECVIAKLPKNAPYAIIAESFSGPIAIKIAAANPEGLSALVFAASFDRKPRAFPGFATALTRYLPLEKAALVSLAKPFTFGRWAQPDLTRQFQETLKFVDKDVLSYRLNLIAKVDASKSLATLTLPILYLQATKDKLVPRRMGQAMQKTAPHTILKQINGPHFLLETQPEASIEAIIGFLNNV